MSKFDLWEDVAFDADLVYYFTPTNVSLYNERSKAYYKNTNLPFLQFIYHGNENTALHCTISGNPGFEKTLDYANGSEKLRFNIDYNHVRQKMMAGRQGGTSVDKSEAPSSIFRRLNLKEHKLLILEFLTIMPVNPLVHTHITQDSAKSNIVLDNFPKETWIWALQSAENFNNVMDNVNITDIDYNWFIDHMNDISHPSIINRVVSGKC